MKQGKISFLSKSIFQFIYFNLFREDCGDNWDYSYVNPPENCHKVNEVMREFLREYEIENSDIADICFVQGDQWYIQGHETCIGAYPEVRFSFLGAEVDAV